MKKYLDLDAISDIYPPLDQDSERLITQLQEKRLCLACEEPVNEATEFCDKCLAFVKKAFERSHA